jgi:hypothetical protein
MGRAPLIYISRGPSRRCTGYDSVAHPVICFSELGGAGGCCVGGQVGVLPGVPARPAADPAVAADSAGARKYTPRVYIFGCIWKYLRGFRLSSAPPRRACVGAQRPRRSDSGQRPGHSHWGYMQPALTSASVEVAQTAGGCDSRRAGPTAGETGTPARSRQPTATLGAGITVLGGGPVRRSPPPRGAGRRAGPRGSSGSTTC